MLSVTAAAAAAENRCWERRAYNVPTNSLSGDLSLDPHAHRRDGVSMGEEGGGEGCGLLCCVKGGWWGGSHVKCAPSPPACSAGLRATLVASSVGYRVIIFSLRTQSLAPFTYFTLIPLSLLLLLLCHHSTRYLTLTPSLFIASPPLLYLLTPSLLHFSLFVSFPTFTPLFFTSEPNAYITFW